MPPEVNVIARRMPIPLFGAGLVEAVPDEALLALEDPFDRDRDGISGRAAIVTDVATGQRRVGRFGWKAQIATLLTFSGDAYTNEMGITNDMFPLEPLGGISQARLRECDLVKDPEDLVDPRTGKRAIDNFEAFMKFLAPLPRGPITDEVRTGEQVFTAIGCASCHVPVADHRRQRIRRAQSQDAGAVFGSVAARRRHRRRHRAGSGAAERDPHAGAVGASTAAAAAARRQRADRERCASIAWRGSIGGDGTLPRRDRADAPRACWRFSIRCRQSHTETLKHGNTEASLALTKKCP